MTTWQKIKLPTQERKMRAKADAFIRNCKNNSEAREGKFCAEHYWVRSRCCLRDLTHLNAHENRSATLRTHQTRRYNNDFVLGEKCGPTCGVLVNLTYRDLLQSTSNSRQYRVRQSSDSSAGLESGCSSPKIHFSFCWVSVCLSPLAFSSTR